MADSKISALTTLNQASVDAAADFVPIVDTSTTTTKKITPDDLVLGALEQAGGWFVPTGTILDFAGTSAPTGFLGCDGAAVSRTTYAALFTAISTTWGVGDGATTFNLPNFQRRVAVGSGGSGTATLANTVGSTGGAETHTLTEAEMPAHTHGISNGAGDGAGGAGGSFASANAAVQSASKGGGGAHNNMQPSAVVLKIIKT
jgi:microcystin-dependent protein